MLEYATTLAGILPFKFHIILLYCELDWLDKLDWPEGLLEGWELDWLEMFWV